MKRSVPFSIVTLLTFVLSACSSTGVPAPIPGSPSLAPEQVNKVSERARQTLANQLGIAVEDIEIYSSEEVEWPDSCLGAPTKAEVCAQEITPGFLGVLLAEEVQYVFHSDASGDNIRMNPGAALSARQVLGTQLGLTAEEVRIISAERIEWNDSCMGITIPGLLCAQVVTPGFKVILEANGQDYVYHTNLTGSDVQLAESPASELKNILLTWRMDKNGGCQTASMSKDTVRFGACDGMALTVPLEKDSSLAGGNLSEDIVYFAEQYNSFEPDTPAGKISLAGSGDVTATPAEQRMIAEWVRLRIQEFHSGQSGAARGLAFAWHREGGLAGICDDVAVYLDGTVSVSSCLGNQPKDPVKVRLMSAQIQKVFEWADTLKSFESQFDDNTSADSVKISMAFSGAGQTQADEMTQMDISALAGELASQARVITDPQGLEAARQTLVTYLESLASGNYGEAAQLYGGSYEPLSSINPEIDPADTTALFRQACSTNGYVCNLKVLNWVQDAQTGLAKFRFTVELQNPDGSLFKLGPCCGADADEFPPLTQFNYQIQEVDGAFRVMDLPIYVP